MEYTLLILMFPLTAFIILGLFSNRLSHKTTGIIGTGALLSTALLSYYAAWDYFTTPKAAGMYQTLIPFNTLWLNMGSHLHIDMGILLDPVSVMMLVVISTVSLMVHIYSLGYMKGEKGFRRYYAFLALFTFSMMGLVLSTNIFQMYIFWELVGVSSYLLIGFYYTKPEAVAASKKAFIVTRFADMFFLIGILVLSYYTQTFDFGSLMSGNDTFFQHALSANFLGASAMIWAMTLIFIGGAGKSAMFPLHIWLPDAMEGPTPVSALIHAATMVVAGVYLVARLFPLYVAYTPEVLEGIAWVGAFTSMFAAIIAIVQTDIKRVLAYSTISQIGFMMVALGVSKLEGHEGLGYMASMFHLFTHAMFKALLFLGAGSIIHAIHSNEMDRMGGLRKYMPVTHLTFLIASLSIAGIPPFSGFFSKDEILSATYGYNTGLGIWMTVVAGLTAFYIFRLYYTIFWGKDNRYAHTPHESPVSMTFPLIFLAIPTLLGGFIPFGHFVTADRSLYTIHHNWPVILISVLVSLTAIFIARRLYQHPGKKQAEVPSRPNGFQKAAYHRFYVDEIYLFITKKMLFNGVARAFVWFDRHVVDSSINGLASMTARFSFKIRSLQSGEIQWYAFLFLFGTLLITALFLFV